MECGGPCAFKKIFQLRGRAEGDLLAVVRPTTLPRMLGEAFVVVGNPVPHCLSVAVFKVFGECTHFFCA
jgi:hypothetical protein